MGLSEDQQLLCSPVRVAMQPQGATNLQSGLRCCIDVLEAVQCRFSMASFGQSFGEVLALLGLWCFRPCGLAGVTHLRQGSRPAHIPAGEMQSTLMGSQQF